jgi:hypothetical protein
MLCSQHGRCRTVRRKLNYLALHTSHKRRAILLTALLLSVQPFIFPSPPAYAKKAKQEADEQPKAGTQAKPESPVMRFTANGATGTPTLDGRATTKAIGPLHMSSAVAVFRQNAITILSDPTDPVTEAELYGRAFSLHQEGSASAPTIAGVAFFQKGFSISALDDSKMEETVKLRDGSTMSGRIVDVTHNNLQIKNGLTIRSVPTDSIVTIASPRCFGFTLQTGATTAGATPSIAFNSIFAPPPVGVATLLPTTKMLEGQLTEHHVGKKILVYSLGAAALTACFAVPIVLAITTPHQLSDVKRAVAVVKKNVKTGKLDDR